MENEKKIFTLIGAGSTVFTPGLLSDLARSDITDSYEVHLYDINLDSAEVMAKVGRRIASSLGSKMKIEAFAEQREALKGANFVTTTIAVGNANGWKSDLEIPRKYGIQQTVGDSVGPGGVLRALRHVPALVSIAQDIADIAPEAWFINYSNPLSANVRGINKYAGIKAFGLCHGTMHTRSKLLQDLNIQSEEVETIFAGINHLCWLLAIRSKGIDIYPELLAAVNSAAGGKDTHANREEGVHSPVSADLSRIFGLYPAPGDRHVAEFFSGYLTQRGGGELHWGLQGGLDMTEEYIGEKNALWDELRGQAEGSLPITSRNNQEAERLVNIAEAIITGKSHIEMAVNMPNNGKIPNLPSDAIVEVPAHVDGGGIHGISVGELPPGIANVLTHRINQQEITVDAAVKQDRALAIQALYLDPLVAKLNSAIGILDDAIKADLANMKNFAG